MNDFRIRKATRADQMCIYRMVIGEMLDPTGLHWSHFWVAEDDETGEVVGIGQLRPHTGGPELGSLVVKRTYQGRGIGAALIHTLLDAAPGAVYLECAAAMVPYYTRFGFEEISYQQAPPGLRRKARIGGTLARWFGTRLAVMALRR